MADHIHVGTEHEEYYEAWVKRCCQEMSTIGEWKSDIRGIEVIVWDEWASEIEEEWFAFKITRTWNWKIRD
jgi:hypothetical protein